MSIKDFFETPFSAKDVENEKIEYYSTLISRFNHWEDKLDADDFAKDDIISQLLEEGWLLCDKRLMNRSDKIPSEWSLSEEEYKSFPLFRSSYLTFVNKMAGIIANISGEWLYIFEVYTGNLYESAYVLGSKITMKPSFDSKGHILRGSLDIYPSYYDDYVKKMVKDFYEIDLPVEIKDIPFENYLMIVRYFGNLTESILRYASKCPWLLKAITDGMHFGKPIPQKVHSLAQWFGVNKNDLNYFLSQKTSAPIAFYLLCRQTNGCSVSEAMSIYKKVLKINEKYDLELEYSGYWRSPIKLKGFRGRIIFSTKDLPTYLIFYVENNLQKELSISKYTRYILDERKKTEEKAKKNGTDPLTLERIEELLTDYNRMAGILGFENKFKLPYNIEGAHDTMVTNFNEIQSEGAGKADSEMNIVKLNNQYIKEPYQYEDDKYIIVAPVLPSDIHREGSILNHCVGSYTSRVISGCTRIYFLRKKNDPAKPLVTIEWKDKNVLQQRGKCNRNTTPEERSFISKWASHYRQALEDCKRKKRTSLVVDSVASEAIEKAKTEAKIKREKAKSNLRHVQYASEETLLAI